MPIRCHAGQPQPGLARRLPDTDGAKVLVLEFRVRARVMVKVRVRVRDSWGTKHLGTKRFGYEMSGSPVSTFSITGAVILSRT